MFFPIAFIQFDYKSFDIAAVFTIREPLLITDLCPPFVEFLYYRSCKIREFKFMDSQGYKLIVEVSTIRAVKFANP